MFVENKPVSCRACGYGPVRGQESSYTDHSSGETIVECSWRCPQCGAHIQSGEISRTPAAKDE